jgi:hypothetical protein
VALSGLAKQSFQIAGLLDSIQKELAFMRSLSGVAYPYSGVTAAQPPAGQNAYIPQHPPAYPEPFLDRFAKVKEEADAKMDDTDRDLLEQTPEQLAAAQVLEELRQRGIEVEDSDTVHPGVEVDAE